MYRTEKNAVPNPAKFGMFEHFHQFLAVWPFSAHFWCFDHFPQLLFVWAFPTNLGCLTISRNCYMFDHFSQSLDFFHQFWMVDHFPHFLDFWKFKFPTNFGCLTIYCTTKFECLFYKFCMSDHFLQILICFPYFSTVSPICSLSSNADNLPSLWIIAQQIEARLRQR